MNRYETLAGELEESIRTGLLRPGDRLPSVRRTSQSRSISPSTVFEAYYLLEARGLIRARPRSGYYVSSSARRVPPESRCVSQPEDTSLDLDVSELVFQILEVSGSRRHVPLGSAFLSPLLFPLARLGKFLASAAQSLDPFSTIDDLTPGSAELRRQIALRYLAQGMQVAADEIVITNGALEALNLCLAATTHPGDPVIVESPTFYSALQALERVGVKAVEVPTHACEGIDLAALERAVTRHHPKACWLMTNFQNPLGCTVPEAKKKALVALLMHYNVPLIEDDVYSELYFGDNQPPPAKAFDTEGLVLHCSSFSKCLAPGYRIGWAAAGRYCRTVAHQKLLLTLTTSTPTQHALAQYLERGGFDRHLRKLRRRIAHQQRIFSQAVGQYFPPGTRATRPSGGYFLWIELPQGVDALKIHRRALSEGISIAPGPIFSATHGFQNCLRLNYGHAWDSRTEWALETLGRLARECRS
jgi:DNA-binding transcriptional MocR family regulator